MEDITAVPPSSEIKYGTQALHDNTDNRRHQNRITHRHAKEYQSHQLFQWTWHHSSTQQGTETKTPPSGEEEDF